MRLRILRGTHRDAAEFEHSYGSGPGYGYGTGCGYGDGYGTGCGSGYGSGYGDSYGHGSGYSNLTDNGLISEEQRCN